MTDASTNNPAADNYDVHGVEGRMLENAARYFGTRLHTSEDTALVTAAIMSVVEVIDRQTQAMDRQTNTLEHILLAMQQR